MLSLLLSPAVVLAFALFILAVMLFTMFNPGGAKRDNVRSAYEQRRRY